VTKALICLDGYRVAEVLDAAYSTLDPSLVWLLVFVSDTRPEAELTRALSRLPGRGPGRQRAEARMHETDQWSEASVREEARAWLTGAGREAEMIVTNGRPEREILRVAEERGVEVVALGGGRGLPGRYPGPGPFPLSPVARYVVDHARCDVLLLRRYIEAADRRA
jgi:nucleotide-binding universal stress UspA family protein